MTSPAGRRLTEAHRRGQLQLRAGLVASLVRLWPALDPQRLDVTADGWAQGAAALIRQSHTHSAGLAREYLERLRRLEVGGAGVTITMPPLPAEQLATSLRVTGPVAIKRLVSGGKTFAFASRTALVLHTGAGSRLALQGGRDTVQRTVAADPEAVGWERVTSGSPCAFCEMLAGRGAVYKTDTVDFEAHDHCACTSEPLYR